jgi:hypothetical protein
MSQVTLQEEEPGDRGKVEAKQTNGDNWKRTVAG